MTAKVPKKTKAGAAQKALGRKTVRAARSNTRQNAAVEKRVSVDPVGRYMRERLGVLGKGYKLTY